MKRVVCENVRSAYNVGNIIRTADALGRGVILLGYTAPIDHKEIQKTALGAEKIIPSKRFDKWSKIDILEKGKNSIVICAEKTFNSIPLQNLKPKINKITNNQVDDVYLIVGNEVVGVEEDTMKDCDIVCHMDMLGIKESLNVGQASAIFMREINRIL